MAIDPNKVTDFNRDDSALQEFFIYCVAVAGRQAKTVSRQVGEMLALLRGDHPDFALLSPFALLNLLHTQEGIAAALKKVGVGCYNQKAEAICRAAGQWVADLLDLATCTVEQLETIRWAGPKTVRFFLLHSRPNQRLAALDTHILKHLAAHGVPVPLNPPGKGPAYLRLEREFLKLADAAGMTPADYDLHVWKQYANA